MLELESLKVDRLDQSIKLLWRAKSLLRVESVGFATEGGYGICVSSQFGCGMGCPFCATAAQGLAGNLSRNQIFLQALGTAASFVVEFGAKALRSVTLAGMGEPLANYSESLSAIKLLTDAGVPALSLSTIGLLDPLRRLAAEPPRFRVYLSLHACTQELRARLIPGSRCTPIVPLIEVVTAFAEARGFGQALVSYLLLRGVNDHDRDLESLINLIKGRPLVVQLLMWNRVNGAGFAPSDHSVATRWCKALGDAGICSYVRPSRGKSIDAACGQLSAPG